MLFRNHWKAVESTFQVLHAERLFQGRAAEKYYEAHGLARVSIIYKRNPLCGARISTLESLHFEIVHTARRNCSFELIVPGYTRRTFMLMKISQNSTSDMQGVREVNRVTNMSSLQRRIHIPVQNRYRRF